MKTEAHTYPAAPAVGRTSAQDRQTERNLQKDGEIDMYL